MAKRDHERSVGRILYVEQGKTQKEIAQRLGRTQKTIGGWVKKYAWRQERDARLSSCKNQQARISEVLSHYTQQTLKYLHALQQAEQSGDEQHALALNKKLSTLSDEVSKWNKRFERLEKDQPSLSTYLYVMDSLFEALRRYDQSLYLKTLDFQDKHLSAMSLKLG